MNPNQAALDHHMADTLAERVFTLKEPWRSRFIAAIAAQVRNGSTRTTASRSPSAAPGPNGEPSQSELAYWLRDRSLCQQVRTMLSAWTRDE